MDVKYDKVADAVYISVNAGKVAKTLEMDDRFNVDMDSFGNVIGFEILDAANQKKLVENLQNNVSSGIPVEIITRTPVAA